MQLDKGVLRTDEALIKLQSASFSNRPVRALPAKTISAIFFRSTLALAIPGDPKYA
jgi:hypothetical protein